MYELLRILFPDMTKDQQIALSRIAWRFTLTFYIVWSLGAFSTMGFPGFAMASRVNDVEDQIYYVTILVSEDNLISVRKAQCDAADKEFATKRLGQLLREYRKLTGNSWQVPSCEELR